MTPAKFVFAVCQIGSEAALKQRWPGDIRTCGSRSRGRGSSHFACPMRHRRSRRRQTLARLEFRAAFARTWGFSLGKVAGTRRRAMRARVLEDARARYTARPPRGVSASARLAARPRAARRDGVRGCASDGSRRAASTASCGTAAPVPLASNEHAEPGDLVLDCVLVEPNEWWLGWHRAGSPETRWPGGVPSLLHADGMISRAYLKLARGAALVRAADRRGRSLRRDRQRARRLVPSAARARLRRDRHRSGRDGSRGARGSALHARALAREGRGPERLSRLPLAHRGHQPAAELHARRRGGDRDRSASADRGPRAHAEAHGPRAGRRNCRCSTSGSARGGTRASGPGSSPSTAKRFASWPRGRRLGSSV